MPLLQPYEGVGFMLRAAQTLLDSPKHLVHPQLFHRSQEQRRDISSDDESAANLTEWCHLSFDLNMIGPRGPG